MQPRYYVTTYDPSSGTYTPQEGVPEGPYPLWSLRVPLRALRALGYVPGDPAVLVQRDYTQTNLEEMQRRVEAAIEAGQRALAVWEARRQALAAWRERQRVPAAAQGELFEGEG